MKRFCMLAALAAVCFFFPVEAKIAESRVALGGVNPGSTEAYLLSTYPDPKGMTRNFSAAHGQYVREYNYGDSFFVTVLEDEGTVLHMLSLGRRNGLATPDGIKVGSTMPELLAAYGAPDLRQIDGEVDYYWYLGEGTKGNLVFHVSYGKVVGIVCGKK